MTVNTNAAQDVVDALGKIMSEQPEAPKMPPLPDTHVTLPGGLLTMEGFITDAEVKELTGLDEEFIAKAGSTPGKMLSSILLRGVVSIGDEKATREMLDSLLSGDRDALLLAIRRATFGDDVELETQCPHCGEMLDVTLSIEHDVPVKSLGDDPRMIILDNLRVGTVVVGLPTGAVQRQILEASDKTAAELTTIMLRGCVNSINGQPVISDAQVLNLGVRDRQKIMDTILAANPGPRLGDIKVSCTFCEKEIPLPLAMVDMFRL